MKLFQVSISAIILRFYLLMLIIIAAGFSGYWIVGILALPVFFSALMGVRFNPKIRFKKTQSTAQRETHHSLHQNTARI